MKQKVEKVLLYVLGGLTLAFGIVIATGWSPTAAGDYTDWMTTFSYAVLWSAMISWLIVLLVSKRHRKDDFKPWTPSERKPVDGWTHRPGGRVIPTRDARTSR